MSETFEYPVQVDDIRVTTFLRVYIPYNQYSKAFDFSWEGARDPYNVDVPNLGLDTEPFAFQFFDVCYATVEVDEGNELVMETPRYNPSPMYYIVGRVLHLDQIKEKYPNHTQAITNLEKFNNKYAVKHGSRYYPFDDNCVMIETRYGKANIEESPTHKGRNEAAETGDRPDTSRSGEAFDPAKTPRLVADPRKKARDRLDETTVTRNPGTLSPKDGVALLPEVARQEPDPRTQEAKREARQRSSGRTNARRKGDNPDTHSPYRRKKRR